MTRFARAKGSKSCNDKVPEQASSWAELKKSVELKTESNEELPGEIVNRIKSKPATKEPIKWAPLDVDTVEIECDVEKKRQKKMSDSTNSKSESLEENSKPEKKKKKKLKKENSQGGNENKTGNVKNAAATAAGNSKKVKSKNFKEKDKFPRKNNSDGTFVEEIMVNGEKVKVVKFQGFNVTHDDAVRLKELKTEMYKQGIPRDKLEAALKLERRRAEKSLSRLKKSVCFHCRGSGHVLSQCPSLTETENTGTGICYKCGSTEHSAIECKVVKGSSFQFAECFICKEQGHIARQCPDNPRGLYPHGGACRECGDVTHLRKDCPKTVVKKEKETMTLGIRNDRNVETLEEEMVFNRGGGGGGKTPTKKNGDVNGKRKSLVKF
ncbi:zinc finger protein cchc domain containing protein, putative [Pediculus humanus corporis]|uniref:Zinc finger protein cchc domain containing protein, putative n=1 Tax=Pediculus humanus subsp. corporis TaxID=121224 RepID=E0VTZ5_PEDHC|nr:zinc finger protein cchc domain containing protein, putative [Pediculus humanus corporis]EEB16851.1 zinc finger protein cchc domain containing protein, putative [Pediculus humanus corporis]